MLAYLTYDEYISLGGTVSASAFDRLERQARRELDYLTLERLKTATTIIPEVKECMVEFIDLIAKSADTENLTSYGNGVESFGFDKTKSLDAKLADIAVKYLPIELISCYLRGV